MTEDIAIGPHEDEDQAVEHRKTVSAHFGGAIYFAQCLEHGLVNALVYLELIPTCARILTVAEWQRAVDGFMDRQFANTLGQLIQRLSRVTSMPVDLQSKLADALRLRNWLAHDYFRERATEWTSREGRDRMITELEECTRLFRDADRLLDATFKPVREKWGITDERLQRAYEEMMSEVRAGRQELA